MSKPIYEILKPQEMSLGEYKYLVGITFNHYNCTPGRKMHTSMIIKSQPGRWETLNSIYIELSEEEAKQRGLKYE